jgi:hypothetical protein
LGYSRYDSPKKNASNNSSRNVCFLIMTTKKKTRNGHTQYS